MRQLRRLRAIVRTDAAVASVALLLTISVAGLLAMHPISAALWVERGYWNIYFEDGLISVFGWGLWAWGALLVTLLAVRERAWTLLAWSGILALLLCDDALELHERFALRVGETDVAGVSVPGEPLAFLILGAVCFTAAVLARAVSVPPARGVHTALLVVLAVGALLGVGADAIQDSLKRGTPGWLVVTLTEQIGEVMTTVVIVVALLAWISHGIDPHRPRVGSVDHGP